jgi:hypothetical protein
MSRNRNYPPGVPWGHEPPGTVIYSLPDGGWQVARRHRLPLIVWPGIPVALAALIIASGSFHIKPSGTPAPAGHPAPAPVRTVIHTRTITHTVTHTVTHVVRAHPLMTGGQVLIALAILAVVVLGVTAIRVTHRGRA